MKRLSPLFLIVLLFIGKDAFATDQAESALAQGIYFSSLPLKNYERISRIQIETSCYHFSDFHKIPEDWSIKLDRPISGVEKLDMTAGHGSSQLLSIRELDGVIGITVNDNCLTLNIVATVVTEVLDEKRIRINDITLKPFMSNTPPMLERLISAYPFYASKQRADQIKGNYKKIQIGMTPQQVKQLLGEPDEIRPFYEPKIYKPKQIGYTHWYLIQRKTDKGSRNDKDEKLVRVFYDLNWIVTRVDHWGFDEQQR